jgi:hypothetical protein
MAEGTGSSEQELQRLWHFKQPAAGEEQWLGEEMIGFFKHSVQKRQAKFAGVADVWNRLIPAFLSDHCALDSFSRGTLVVLVDSASHMYELKQLLLAGLQQQLLLACKSSGLRKINLRPGRWYDGERPAERKLRF